MDLSKVLGSKYVTKKEEKVGEPEATTSVSPEAAGSDSGSLKTGKGKPGPKPANKS